MIGNPGWGSGRSGRGGFTRKRAAQSTCIRRLKARETEAMPLVTRPPRAVAIDGRHSTTRATTSLLPVRSSAHLPLKRRTPGVPEHLVRLDAERGGPGEAQGLSEVCPGQAANFWECPCYPRSGS